MSSWEERMAVRTATRRALANEEEYRMEHPEAWTAFVEDREGFSAWVYECTSDCSDSNGGWTFYPPLGNEPDHQPHVVFSHGHYFHGNVMADAATKEWIPGAIFTIALSDDMPPAPDSCPVCDDFNPADWTSPAAGSERSDPEGEQ